MKTHSAKQPGLNSAEQAAWFFLWFSLPLSLKAAGLSIILAGAIILFGFIKHPFRPDRAKLWYLVLPVIFFLLYARELFGGSPFLPAWKEAEQKLALFALPVMFLLSRISREKFTGMALAGLISGLTIAGCIMLLSAAMRFGHSGDWGEFTYHNLAKPVHTGAVYFSLYLLFALFTLDNPAFLKDQGRVKAGMAVFLLLLLLLCASKLMIILGLPLLAWHHRKYLNILWNKRRLLLSGLVILVILGSIPLTRRLQFLASPNLEMVRSVDFKDSPEPNGLTLRLIFWRFGIEILNEQKAWFTGVGMSRSQSLLNDKIVQYHMYTGTRTGDDTGYLNYNFHNQYIETLVKTGLPGLAFLTAILVIFALQRQNRLFAPKLFMVVMAGFFVTESVLERQAGIVFFSLLISAYFSAINHDIDTHDRQD
jgi:O-antigen ligase